MQQRIHASRAQFVAVPAKLGDNGEPVDFIFGGVVKDVNLDKAEEKLPDLFIASRLRCPTTKIGSENAQCACPLTTRVLYGMAISTSDIQSDQRLPRLR